MHRLSGPAADLHHRAWPSPPAPAVWFLAADRPALVLGSTQPVPKAGAAAGLDVVRRRSGGGAVLVEPGGLLWVDLLLPAGDRLWTADVGRAFLWLGEVWAAAIGQGATIHGGPPDRSPLARTVCFAGLGPGEVTVDGRKVVGISQRRTRDAALFQCAALLRWEPDRLAALTGVAPADLADLAGRAAAVPGLTEAALERAFLRELAGL